MSTREDFGTSPAPTPRNLTTGDLPPSQGADSLGPWTAAKGKNGQWHVYCASGERVCSVAQWSADVEAADARLIAAAPDMLEALRMLIAWEDDAHDTSPTSQYNAAVQAARAAIAKATGAQP